MMAKTNLGDLLMNIPHVESPLVTAYFDGACEPRNPGGNMGFGAYILKNGTKVCEWSDFALQDAKNTNNVAEYKACLWALKTIIEKKLQHERVIIHGDSKLVVNQMNGHWKIKGGHYTPYAVECLQLIQQFKSIRFKWIPREQNAYADELSKRELTSRGVKIAVRKKI